MLIFTDLDDTLLQTERKLHLRQKPHETPINVVEEGSGVKPTFTLDHQRRFLGWLEQGNVIPVTGRDRRSFEALRLSWGTHAILNHGATVLEKTAQGWKQEPEWTQRMEQEASTYREMLDTAIRLLTEHEPDASKMFHRIIHEGDLPICTVSKVRSLPEDALSEALEKIRPVLEGKFYVHLNSNNLSFIPDAVRKKHAVLYLQEKLGNPLSVGIGDSHTDLEFMQVCDFWMTPQNSQIQKLLEHP